MLRLMMGNKDTRNIIVIIAKTPAPSALTLTNLTNTKQGRPKLTKAKPAYTYPSAPAYTYLSVEFPHVRLLWNPARRL